MRSSVKTQRKKARTGRARQTNWPVAYRWAAMGTLVAYSAVGTETFNLARAQDIAGPRPAQWFDFRDARFAAGAAIRHTGGIGRFA